MLPTANELTELLHQVAEGDRNAFGRLYSATSAKLYGVVLRILKESRLADEVLQEAYLKVWSHAETFDRKVASPITWMVSIARHTALDELRKKALPASEAADKTDEIPCGAPGVQEGAQQLQMLNKLANCLGHLDQDRHEAVQLAYLEGWSRQQLAERFEQPVNTIKTWLHRSLKQLKGCLEA